MFTHAVLFEIEPGEVSDYRRDSPMWARYARKARGFIAYHTMQRLGFENQYASVYTWKTKRDNDRFMKELHDWLVNKSKAKVQALGYYNLKAVDTVKVKFKTH